MGFAKIVEGGEVRRIGNGELMADVLRDSSMAHESASSERPWERAYSLFLRPAGRGRSKCRVAASSKEWGIDVRDRTYRLLAASGGSIRCEYTVAGLSDTRATRSVLIIVIWTALINVILFGVGDVL
jgi:hypothetical protein